MSNVLPFKPRDPVADLQKRLADSLPKLLVVTYSIHFDSVKGQHWIKKRNPGCSILLSIVAPTNDDRIATIQHVAVEDAMSGEEAVILLRTLPVGGSIAWRRL